MEVLKNINEVLNTIYLICAGPILLCIAYKGLEQIKTAKENSKITQENSKIQSKREAFKLAGEQCVYFATEIIPQFDKLLGELQENKSRFFEKFEVVMTSEKITMKELEKIEDVDFKGIIDSKYLQNVLNSLEGFSLFFASGVASENIGYITAGRVYCEMVNKLLPFILLESKNGYFKNILFLFMIWQNRCKQEDIKMKQKELERELENTLEIKLKTIGT